MYAIRSYYAGVNVQGVKVSVFVITGILVGIAAFVQACKIGNVTPASSGKSYEMYAIAAVVLGGVSMSGGKGVITSYSIHYTKLYECRVTILGAGACSCYMTRSRRNRGWSVKFTCRTR